MVKEHSADHHPCPSGLTSADTPSDISIGSLGFYLSRIFVEFSVKPVYPTMVDENFQIYGIQITGKSICDS